MENQDTNNELMVEIKYLRKEFSEHSQRVEVFIEQFERRLRAVEDWKLVFVAKYTVYSAVALFLGSAIAQIVLQLVVRKL